MVSTPCTLSSHRPFGGFQSLGLSPDGVAAGELALVADWLTRPFFAGFFAVSGVSPLPSLCLPRFFAGLSGTAGLPPMRFMYS